MKEQQIIQFKKLMKEKAKLCEDMSKQREEVKKCIEEIAYGEKDWPVLDVILMHLSDRAIPAKSDESLTEYRVNIWGNEDTLDILSDLKERYSLIKSFSTKDAKSINPKVSRRITVTIDIGEES